MTKDNLEYVEGGILRDQFGRKEYTLRGLHQARATGEALEGGTIVDADKREQIVLRDINGNTITALNTFTGYAGIYDITASPYNASTGTTDNGPAINSAITAAKAGKGKVYIPPGVYKYSTPLVLDGWEGGGLIGVGDNGGEINMPGSELRFTGSGSGRAISARSIFGFTFKGILFTYNNAGGNFTGDLIDIDGSTHGADCTNFSIIGCGSRHLSTITARSIIRMNQAINGTIYDCGFAGATNSLRLGDPGGSYVVGVKVQNCTFNNNSDAHILIGSLDAENIHIEFCRFEASTNTAGVRGATTAVDGANCAMYDLAITHCWFGDAGASTDWIKGLRGIFNGPVNVSFNYFAEAGVGGTHINTDTTTAITLNMIGNHFQGGLNCFNVHTSSSVNFMGNLVGATTNLCNTGGDRARSQYILGNVTSGATVANTAYDTLPSRVAIGVGQVAGAFPGGTLTAGLTGLQEQIVLACSNSSTLVALGKKAGIYTAVGGSDSGCHRLILQAPTDDATREVNLVAGTTPTPVFRANNTGLAFYNVAPVAQAARAGQLTDSTGGVVSGTLAAGITDATAKNAIASLAAKVNALETIIHNLGLSA